MAGRFQQAVVFTPADSNHAIGPELAFKFLQLFWVYWTLWISNNTTRVFQIVARAKHEPVLIEVAFAFFVIEIKNRVALATDL